MSGSVPEGRPSATGTDPVLRFLGGCLLVFVGLGAIVLIGALVIGWRLSRDEAPGRPEETILLGDETRYWCLDLKPDDAGLTAVLAKMDAEARAAREEILKDSPLRMFAFAGRRNDIATLFPLKLEVALAPQGAWSGRATFTHGIFRMRAMVKLLRWIVGRDRSQASATVADGVDVTTIVDRKDGVSVSFASVGNRLLLAGDADRLRRALESAGSSAGRLDPAVASLHDSVRLAGEDAWAFAAGPAVASFDVNERDELAFRIVATVPGAADERTADDRALDIARSFLPHVEADAFRLDEGSPERRPDGSWRIEGRIPDVSRRVAAVFLRFSADRATRRSEPEEPSAIPSPPSPPPPSGPRSDTPAAPPREGTPSPAR